MINLQILSMLVLFGLTVACFFIGRQTGLQVLKKSNGIYSRISKFIMWLFGAFFLIFGVIFLKNKSDFSLLYYNFNIFEKTVVLDSSLAATIGMVMMALLMSIEAGYRLVFKKNYERHFYTLLLLCTGFFYYLLIYDELPKKVFPIGTYDGHLNPKIVKMKKEEEKRLEIENDLKNQTQKENVK